MTIQSFWRTIGIGLAYGAVWLGRAALWASQHKDVVMTVAVLAGHPEVAAAVNTAVGVVEAVKTPTTPA